MLTVPVSALAPVRASVPLPPTVRPAEPVVGMAMVSAPVLLPVSAVYSTPSTAASAMTVLLEKLLPLLPVSTATTSPVVGVRAKAPLMAMLSPTMSSAS